jgi:hypothetical protein
VRYRIAVASVTNISEMLDGHVALEVCCVDRLYLNAYVPKLQVGGPGRHLLDQPPRHSRELLERIGNRFRRDVKSFAAEKKIPILHLKGKCSRTYRCTSTTELRKAATQLGWVRRSCTSVVGLPS